MTAPRCNIDFYSDETLCETVHAYHRMLDLGPVVWMEQHGFHAICGFEAVTKVLRDHRNFRSGEGVSIDADVNKLLVGSTLNSDPPQHDQTRAITFGPLTPKALGDVTARIEAEAAFIADHAVRMGRFDAARDLAPHVPLTIVRDLVGLGDGGHAHMLDWGAATFELMGDPGARRSDAVARLKAMRGFLEDAATLDGLSEDGWARRATAMGLAQGYAPERARELMRDYIAPSLDTTISAIGYGMALFAQNPEQWSALRADRSLMRNAIEEIVRLNTPIRAFSRLVEADCDVEGIELEAGNRVLVVYGAANRDVARFETPDRFDITRDLRGHVGFGHGLHACLGMHLARLEMAALFNALADRVERFELAGELKTVQNATIHAYGQVPLKVA